MITYVNKIENEITSYEKKKKNAITRIEESHKNQTKLVMYVKRDYFCSVRNRI